jgi:hypothetical protein
MEDETYKTSVIKKRMVFLALRKSRSFDSAKTMKDLSRGFKRAFKKTDEPATVESAKRINHLFNRS